MLSIDNTQRWSILNSSKDHSKEIEILATAEAVRLTLRLEIPPQKKQPDPAAHIVNPLNLKKNGEEIRNAP